MLETLILFIFCLILFIYRIKKSRRQMKFWNSDSNYKNIDFGEEISSFETTPPPSQMSHSKREGEDVFSPSSFVLEGEGIKREGEAGISLLETPRAQSVQKETTLEICEREVGSAGRET